MTLEEITITVSSERMSGESEALADTIWTGIQLQQGADSSGLGTLHLDNLVEAVGFLTTLPHRVLKPFGATRLILARVEG